VLNIVRCLIASIGCDADVKNGLARRNARFSKEPDERLAPLARCHSHWQAIRQRDVKTGC
jgi:hypothetical protein